MTAEIFKYGLLISFIALTFGLSWIGMQKAKSIKGFSIGNKDLSPILVGITLASSTASTALFVINPGFIYQDGMSAFLHYGVAAPLGSFAAILLLTKRFRKSGDSLGSLTIPGWIYDRYQHRGLSLLFAFTNLLTITFVVLILVGSSYLLSTHFPISQQAALIACMAFVFSYVLMGGVYAHAYTNAFQGVMMLFIALFLFFQGFKYFNGDIFGSIASVGENYAKAYNPDSKLYTDFFSVFLSGFLVTFALMLQPHILSKVLYLKDDKSVNKFIWTAAIVGSCYALVLFVGFYAKLSGVEAARQDTVVAQYILQEFSTGTIGPYISAFITVTLLAAGLSTLDGILVALSAMTVNDIYRPFAKFDSPEQYQQRGLKLSRFVLVGIGLIALALSWTPPMLVGLFAQQGIYALAAASMVPILFGIFGPKDVPASGMLVCALIGLIGHLFFTFSGGVYNPAVSSASAMLLSFGFYLLLLAYMRFKPKAATVEE